MAIELQSNALVETPKAVSLDIPKKISPQLTEAIRKDILILTSKFGGMDAMEQLGDQEEQRQAESQSSAHQDAAQIDWSKYLEIYLANFDWDAQPLQGQTVQIDWDLLLNWTPSPGKTLEENLADLAARYQNLWRVITAHFSGAQQMELLARLDMMMMTKLNELFQSDLGRLYDFLATNGQREAAETIRPSVQRAGFALAHGQSPANGSSQLEPAGGGQPPVGQPGVIARGEASANTRLGAQGREGFPPGAFGQSPAKGPLVFLAPKELRQAREFVQRLDPPDYGVCADTEQAAFLKRMDAAILTLKTEVFFENADLSPGFAETMRRAIEQFLTLREPVEQPRPAAEAYTEWTAQPQPAQQFSQLEKSGKAAFSFQQQRADAVRRDAAEVSRYMVETLARTGSVREAVLEGARFARSLAQERGETHRDNEQLFWKMLLFGSGDGTGRKAPMQLIRENWNQFIRSMDFQRERSRALYFGAYESGGLQMSGKSGGGLQDAVTAGALAVFLLLPPLIAVVAGRPGLGAGLFGLGLCVSVAFMKFQHK